MKVIPEDIPQDAVKELAKWFLLQSEPVGVIFYQCEFTDLCITIRPDA